MKLDKQALKKHHFWILLGVYSLFAFLLIILVPVLIGSEISEKEAAYKSAEDSLKASSSSPTTTGFLDEQKVQIEALDKRRDSIWREMYTRQQGMLAFPPDLAAKLDSITFGGEIDDRSRTRYREESVYYATYAEMANIIKPTEFAGGWQSVLHPINWRNDRLPTSEETWLSLEDMCVRREVLTIISEANQSTAKFQEVKPRPAGLPASPLGEQFSKRWVNRLYQIDLVLTEKTRGNFAFGGKIKNISGRRQVPYSLDLNVWLTPDPSVNERARPTLVRFPIASLSADQEANLTEVPVRVNQRPVDTFRVEMNHSLKTAPIKRLEQLVLGVNPGHRLADRKSQMTKFSAKIMEEAGTAAAASSSGGPMGPMGPMGILSGGGIGGGGKGPGGPAGVGGFGGDSSAEGATVNGVSRSRYIDVTDQVRRMPVAVLLIVDQSNLQDVLAAFSNSPRMRYQITQYHWKRFYGSVSSSHSDPNFPGGEGADQDDRGRAGPQGPGGGPKGPGAFGPMGPGGFGPMGPMGPGGFGPMGPGGFGPMGPGGFGPMGPGGFGPMGGFGSQPSSEQSQVSLVELAIYGIANLYERPAPVDAADSTKSAGTPVTPMTPATPTTPAAVDPAKPADPMKPAGDPAKPADPMKPAGDPAKPADPMKPGTPAKDGDKPATPAPPKGNPGSPDKPGTPAKPGEPIKP